MEGKNLSVDERVRLYQTGDSSLDGLTGLVMGTSSRAYMCNFNIVLLDVPYNGEKAINIIDSCLERV